MEVRGIGILDIERLYGVGACEKRVCGFNYRMEFGMKIRNMIE